MLVWGVVARYQRKLEELRIWQGLEKRAKTVLTGLCYKLFIATKKTKKPMLRFSMVVFSTVATSVGFLFTKQIWSGRLNKMME